MTTRLYLHNTSNGTANLPTTKQSAQATGANATAVTVNKNMTTTIGTTQTSLSSGSVGGYIYWSRWVSDIISQSTIAANTWTFTFAYLSGFGSSDANVRICIYVWRPGTGKVANVCDATVSQTFNTSETGYKLTVAGSAISGIQSNDVLCVEFMTGSLSSGVTCNFFFDGTTAVSTNNTAASSCASYIETPETISMGAITPIATTVTGKTVTNKIIVKG